MPGKELILSNSWELERWRSMKSACHNKRVKADTEIWAGT